MGNGTRGRPRVEGERYPSGKLKPKEEAPLVAPAPSETGRKAISGVIVQRMIENAAKLFGDQRYGTELMRLGMAGQLTPSDIAVGMRTGAVYRRAEYWTSKRRSAAAPHYIREFVADGADAEASGFIDKSGRVVKNGKAKFESAVEDTRTPEQREIDDTQEFKDLQAAIPREYRDVLEQLCVEDRHVDSRLPLARAGLSIVRGFFKEQDKKKKAKSQNTPRAKSANAAAAPEQKSNPLKTAFLKAQRALSPHLDEEGLERAWDLLNALKSREDFRLEKSSR